MKIPPRWPATGVRLFKLALDEADLPYKRIAERFIYEIVILFP
jgi:hypothetical protein